MTLIILGYILVVVVLLAVLIKTTTAIVALRREERAKLQQRLDELKQAEDLLRAEQERQAALERERQRQAQEQTVREATQTPEGRRRLAQAMVAPQRVNAFRSSFSSAYGMSTEDMNRIFERAFAGFDETFRQMEQQFARMGVTAAGLVENTGVFQATAVSGPNQAIVVASHPDNPEEVQERVNEILQQHVVGREPDPQGAIRRLGCTIFHFESTYQGQGQRSADRGPANPAVKVETKVEKPKSPPEPRKTVYDRILEDDDLDP